MTLLTAALPLHAIFAVLGVGQIGALAAISFRPEPMGPPIGQMALILRWVTISLAGMLLTGIALVAASAGVQAHTLWFRISIGLFVAIGVLTGILRANLRRANSPDPSAAERYLPRIRMEAAVLCLLVVGIVVLMVSKPA